MGGSAKKQTIGYRYYFTLQMGLGRGPINELMEIRVGDKMAWSGSVTESGRIQILAGALFGGDKGEGGIEGPLDICMGDATQGPNPLMTAMRGSMLSAFRGVTTFVFDGLICSLNPYPKPWKFRIRRTTKGWDREPWYPERANVLFYDTYTTVDEPTIQIGYIGNPDFYTEEAWKSLYEAQMVNMKSEIQFRRRVINAMNPAHILMEIATNKSWGRGMPDDQIDFDSFKIAADILYCEGFGLCYRWNRQSGLEDVIGEIINTIGGMQYVSRLTGKLTLRLIRDDYDVEGLPVFTRTSGILSIESSDQGGSDAGFNEVNVKYRSPLTGEVATVRYQNLGSVMSDGGINSTTTEYLGIPDRNLALRVAARDVRTNTGDISRLKLTFDRRGYPIEPGVPFVLSDPETGIERMVMRAITVESEDYVRGTITINCLTDIFGLPLTTYVGNEPAGEDEPSGTPHLPKAQRLVEATYRQVYQSLDRANFDTLTPDVAFVGAVAVEGTYQDQRFDLILKAEGEADFGEAVGGDFSDWAKLPQDIDQEEFLLVFAEASMPNVATGSVALVDDEIIQVLSIDSTTNTVTFKRGCLDTVPDEHAKDTFVFFYDTGSAESEREFVAGETVTGKVLSETSSQTMDPSLAQTLTVDLVGRFNKPYPPACLLVDGESLLTSSTLGTGATLTWARRNRVTQMDTVVGHDEGDISPEVGQTTSIVITQADNNAPVADWTGLTGTSQTLTFDYVGDIRFQMFSVRDGEESFQRYDQIFSAPGSGGSTQLTTEDGNRLLTENSFIIIAE
jgi:hypothetical protein